MAPLLEKKTVYGIMKGYNDKLEKPAANVTAPEDDSFTDWMNRPGVARSSIVLGIEPRMDV